MSQNRGPTLNFLQHLLFLASRPTTGLDTLLQSILERVIGDTRSDAGGGISVFETSDQGPTLVVSALRGKLAEKQPNQLNRPGESPSTIALKILLSGQPHGIVEQASDSAHLPLLASSRSALWLPLPGENRVTGLLHVESQRPKHYSQQHLQQLDVRAKDAMPAIFRLLLREQMVKTGVELDMVGVSRAFLKLERQIQTVASYSFTPVLITGERGSGKELAAWAIHLLSDRRDKPFIPVLASAFAEGLVADELFGHERHAFTGAAQARSGKFQAAEGGTIFLDEVADIHPTVQTSLLRVIERGELQRIGQDRPQHVNVRVVTATNRNLSQLIAEGQFREDLFDRLSMFEIRVPPLRERGEDIPLLASHFLSKYCQQTRPELLAPGTGEACAEREQGSYATAEFYQALQQYDWPGNVRELQKVILRLTATLPDQVLDCEHLPDEIKGQKQEAASAEAEDLTLDAATRKHIQRVLRMSDYNQTLTARTLGLPLSTLRSKIKKLGVEVKSK